jgi:hypothetical protein
VDVKKGTFILKDVGVDVDEVLARKLKERGDAKGDDGAKPQAADAGKTRVVAISAKTKIYIKFRSSPSIANNLELGLKDLQPMVDYPVTVEVALDAEPPVAAKVVAWRGTPWKVN